MAYHIGDSVKLYTSVPFKDENGTAADPTTVTFLVQDPSGNEETFVYVTDAEVVKAGTGDYYMAYTVDEAGRWHYRVKGTGAVVAAEDKSFTVLASAFASP